MSCRKDIISNTKNKQWLIFLPFSSQAIKVYLHRPAHIFHLVLSNLVRAEKLRHWQPLATNIRYANMQTQIQIWSFLQMSVLLNHKFYYKPINCALVALLIASWHISECSDMNQVYVARSVCVLAWNMFWDFDVDR